MSCIPVIGFIATLILSIAGRNRNVKNFERAILAYYLIAIIVILIALIVIRLAFPAAIPNTISAFRTILSSVSFS